MRGLRTGVAIALTALLVGGGGAYAASQITSSQIKNGTIPERRHQEQVDHDGADR